MVKPSLAVIVECYAGHRGEESPRRFYLGERVVEINEILDRWLDPEHRYFKVRGNDDGVYILRHDTAKEEWELTLYDSSKSEQTHCCPR